MNSIETQIKAYKCKNCGQIYTNQYVADKCCQQYHCNICGKETPKYLLICEQCREQRNYDKAEKITLQEWEEKYPDHMVFFNDEYYYSVEDLLDSIDYSYNDFPSYCYGTDKVVMEVDPDQVLEGVVENGDCEDLDFSDEAYKEFKNIIKYWNDKYREYYYMQSDIIILIPEELKKEYLDEE